MSGGSKRSPGQGSSNLGTPRQETSTCPSVADEPRGPDVLLSGLCVICGVATTERNPAGHPQHATAA